MATKLKESYVKSVEVGYKLKYRTVPDLLRYHASERPDSVAYVFLSADGSSEKFFWKEVYYKSLEIAKSLVAFGIKTCELVAISIRACPDWLFVNFGISLAGAIPVGVSFTYKDGSDVVALMEKLETCSTMFLDPGPDNETWDIFTKLTNTFDKNGNMKSQKMPSLKRLICLSEPRDADVFTLGDLKRIAKDSIQLPAVSEDDIVYIFQTSGSTGIPKVIAHTHKSLSHWGHFFHHIGLRPDDRYYNDRPFQWFGGYPKNIYIGETRVTRSRMGKNPENEAEFVYKMILQEKCTALATLPTFVSELMLKELPSDWPLRIIYTGGQPIAKHLADCIDKGVAKILSIAYVSSETNSNAYNQVSRHGDFTEYACGVPFPGVEVKIIGDDGDIVSPYARGEICIRSGGLFKGYLNDPEKTDAVLMKDGWYKTDDLGFLTDEGLLYVEGRKSDMIISGGLNVAPAILENVLKNCPGVLNAMAVPIPHVTLHQVICACFIVKPGSDADGEKLREYCEGVHSDKAGLFTVLPKYYLRFESFPEMSTGKPSRKGLKVDAVSRIQELNK